MRLAIRIALVLLALTPVALAQDCVTPEGAITSSSESRDGTLRSFTGTVYPFHTVVGVLQLQVTGGTYTGQFVFRGENGMAYGTISGYFTSPYTYAERMTFTKGDGKYTGITGSINFTGEFNPDGTATDWTVGGEVCLP